MNIFQLTVGIKDHQHRTAANTSLLFIYFLIINILLLLLHNQLKPSKVAKKQ